MVIRKLYSYRKRILTNQKTGKFGKTNFVSISVISHMVENNLEELQF